MTRRPTDPASIRDAVRAAVPEAWRNAMDQRQAEDAANRRNRGGRPKAANPRAGQVMVRLTADERAILDERAGPRGIAEYLRALGLGKRPRIARAVPPVNQDAWRELAAALANLNQLARHVNEGRGDVSESLAPVLEDVRRRVVALRASLLGQDDGDEGAAP